MTDPVKYDQYYRDDPAACGDPFAESKHFAAKSSPARCSTWAVAKAATR